MEVSFSEKIETLMREGWDVDFNEALDQFKVSTHDAWTYQASLEEAVNTAWELRD